DYARAVVPRRACGVRARAAVLGALSSARDLEDGVHRAADPAERRLSRYRLAAVDAGVTRTVVPSRARCAAVGGKPATARVAGADPACGAGMTTPPPPLRLAVVGTGLDVAVGQRIQ